MFLRNKQENRYSVNSLEYVYRLVYVGDARTINAPEKQPFEMLRILLLGDLFNFAKANFSS